MFGLLKLFKKNEKVPTANAEKSKEEPYFPTASESHELTECEVKVWSTEEIRQEILSSKKVRRLMLDGKLTKDAYNILKKKGYYVSVHESGGYRGMPFFVIEW